MLVKSGFNKFSTNQYLFFEPSKDFQPETLLSFWALLTIFCALRKYLSPPFNEKES